MTHLVNHQNFHRIVADSYFELGFKTGDIFRAKIQGLLAASRASKHWSDQVELAKSSIQVSNEHFPHLLTELKGYAEGARISFEELWALNMEDELDLEDHCTTISTNSSSLIAHNEDWDASAKGLICVVEKTVKSLTILELFYPSTLGGNSISINSHGFIHTVNTLTHQDCQKGVPRNLIARWLSETSDPKKDLEKLSQIPRSSGYHHGIFGQNGNAWSVECSATKMDVMEVTSPFVHTNHYLGKLNYLEDDDGSCGSELRYCEAFQNVNESMDVNAAKKIMSIGNGIGEENVFNPRTIARVIVDINTNFAFIWLLNEAERGWIKYPLNFIGSR